MQHLPSIPHSSGTPLNADVSALKQLASNIRYQVVQMSHNSGAPHLGSALSCIDILVTAYWRAVRIDPQKPDNADRDRLILSKGHAASALYATLSARGLFPETWLDKFAQHGSPLAEQPAPKCAPGVELATGSLGHGLPVGIGMALAARIAKKDYRVFVVMSDGECNEGSVWEAAMFAPAQRLGRLVVVIDYNKWQATGRSDEVMSLSSLSEKWRAFGWNACEVDGHSIEQLSAALSRDFLPEDKPTAIIAHTVKGKGVSFMEDDNNWHYRIPTEDEVAAAAQELART
jgi:transketolase